MKGNPKSAFYLGCYVACFFAAWTLRATFLYSVDEAITSPILKAIYSNVVKLIVWVLPALAYVYWVKRKSPEQYWGFSKFPSRTQWTHCLLATAAFLLVVAFFEVGLGHKSVSVAALASTPWILSSLSLVVSPFLEEVLFRGFVLRELLGFTGLAFANPLASVLFVGVHLPYWLSHGGLTHAVMTNCAGIFLFSLLAGWLFARTGSVWPPTLSHAANNTLSALLVG